MAHFRHGGRSSKLVDTDDVNLDAYDRWLPEKTDFQQGSISANLAQPKLRVEHTYFHQVQKISENLVGIR